MTAFTEATRTAKGAAPVNGHRSIVGVVLAGTHSWQTGGFEMLLPRPLAPVVNVPLILHVLHWLRAGEVRTAIICINRGGSAVRGLLGDGGLIGMDLYYHEDRMPRGPAGCALDAATPFSAAHYVVAEANTIPSMPLGALLSRHRQESAEGTITVGRSRNGTSPGAATMRPSGVYVFGRRALLSSSPKGYEDLKEGLIPRLYKQNMHVATVEAPSMGPRCQDLDSYLELNFWTLSRMRSRRPSNGRALISEAVIEPAAQVAAGARIEGLCLVGRGTRIDEGAIVIGPAVIGRNCRIGAGSVVRRSVVWDRSEILPRTKVDGGVFTEFGEFRSRRGLQG